MLTNGSDEDDLDASSPPRQLHRRVTIVPLPKDEVKHREPCVSQTESYSGDTVDAGPL
jgi:hypothetical protein